MALSAAARAVFAQTEKRSQEGLATLRALAREMFGSDESIIIGVNGSYARREATGGSDIDLFFLHDRGGGGGESQAQKMQSAFRAKAEASGYRLPPEDGVFSAPLSVSSLCGIIGGQADDNVQITRRILLLLEGDWLFNESGLRAVRQKLLSHYVPRDLRRDQICLYFLNDIIRYWRTICVDFEFKSQAGNPRGGKPREIRLIKLRFSRMLLFFAGVMAVGVTHNLDDKLGALTESLALPPLARLREIGGAESIKALEFYAEFLSALDNSSIRASLSTASPAQESRELQELRTKARLFREELFALLQSRFHPPNPLIPALVL